MGVKISSKKYKFIYYFENNEKSMSSSSFQDLISR